MFMKSKEIIAELKKNTEYGREHHLVQLALIKLFRTVRAMPDDDAHIYLHDNMLMDGIISRRTAAHDVADKLIDETIPAASAGTTAQSSYKSSVSPESEYKRTLKYLLDVIPADTVFVYMSVKHGKVVYSRPTYYQVLKLYGETVKDLEADAKAQEKVSDN